jgi:hypothetical protein
MNSTRATREGVSGLVGAARLQAWYETALFPPSMVELYRFVDQYAAECARLVAEEIGLFDKLAEPRALEGVLDELKIVQLARAFARRVVQILCYYGAGVSAPGAVQLVRRGRLFDLDELRAKGMARDPNMAPAFAMADKVRDSAVAFCRGALADGAVRAKVHIDFFVTCPIGRQSSELGGAVIQKLVEERKTPVEILELGGGTMSGAVGALDKLRDADLLSRVQTYHFTELNPFFVLDARKSLPARYPDVSSFQFHMLNFDRPLQADGIGPSCVDIVFGVNALHCAKDMRFTLSQIAGILRPGGVLVIPQFTRGAPDKPLPLVDFVCDPLSSYWDVQLDASCRPIHGLLDAGTWRSCLLSAGFDAVQVFPEESDGVRCFDEKYFIGAVLARKPAG